MSHDNEKDFEMDKDLAGLAQALREARPHPEPVFTERLDQAVADHFPPEWAEEATHGRKGRVGSRTERLGRWLAGNRTLLPTLAGAVGVLFVVAVAVTSMDSGQFGSGGDSASDELAGVESKSASQRVSQGSAGSEPTGASASDAVEAAAAPAGGDYTTAGAQRDSRPLGAFQLNSAGNRDVARKAEITLGTDPDGVQDVANEVVSVTDEHKGIVMNSNVTDGEAGEAGAEFSLLIPADQIESAVADLSGIADLRSRSQELTDITAPVNRTEDSIADSKAKIKSLLGELEETFDEDERAAIERKVRWERRELRWQETRLKRLQRRVDYTPVSLMVETGGESSSDDSAWGLSDAVDDAGKLLGVAAGVTLLALAIAIPIGIVVLIALALNRAWVRRGRRRVLADE